MSITNGIVSSKRYDKRYDFNFEIVNFPLIFLMEMFLEPQHMMYISLLIRLQKCVLMLKNSTTETCF